MKDTLSPSAAEAVELVRARADILEVVGAQVVLKKRGRNHIGLCPFHSERTPSFNVNPERGIYKCFGCGEGGDVFTFVMKTGNVGFGDALAQLAERYGVPLPERREAAGAREAADHRKAMREANQLALTFYRDALAGPGGAEARAYLERRGVPPEMVEHFALGFAPGAGEALHRYLVQRGVPVAVQVAAGLVRERDGGNGCYDTFRGRLLFPIQGEMGQVLGFGGRALADGQEPKYLNTQETPLYSKGEVLYGLHLAKDAIRNRDRAILMEGYMDVLTAHQHGFTEAVGVLGTALTPMQARSLLRYTASKRVIVSYDADRAGRNATRRGVEVLEEVAGPAGLSVRIISVPSGKDPDAFLRAAGSEAFEGLLEKAQDLLSYQVDQAIAASGGDLSSPAGQAAALAACVPLLRRLPSEGAVIAGIRDLGHRLQMPEHAVELELRRHGIRLGGSAPAPTGRPGDFRRAGGQGGDGRRRGPDGRFEPGRGGAARTDQGPLPRVGAGHDPTRQPEQGLIYLIAEEARLRADVLPRLEGIPFRDPLRAALLDRIGTWPADQELSLDRLQAAIAGTPEAAALSTLMFEAQPERWSDSAKIADDFVRALEKHDRKQELSELDRLRSSGQLSHEEMEPILRRVMELKAEILALDRQSYLETPDGGESITG